MLLRLIIFSVLPWAALSAPGVECPVPGDPAATTQEVCDRYTMCDWTDATCVLDGSAGYIVQETHVVHTGLEADIHKKNTGATMYGKDVVRLRATATAYDNNRLGIAIRDAESERYEVPVDLRLPPLPTPPPADPRYSYNFSVQGLDFTFQVLHEGAPILTSLPQLVYEDQFIETTLLLGAADIYGFGENNHDRLRHDLEEGATWPVFAHDHGPGFEKEALYGVHPFFLGIEDDAGRSFGMLILNSNAMEYKFFMHDGNPALTYRTTGGVLDMYVFVGDSPLEVLELYHRTIGLPTMPPYWGLGFQLCRWGYTDTQDIRDTRERMRAARIPQDIQYADIDYMDGKRDFTIDQTHFSELPNLVQQLRDEEVRFVLIYDPAIAADFGTYPVADRGVAADAFVRWLNASLVPQDQCDGCGDYIAGHVWPSSPALYPNFLANRTVQWWTAEIGRFLDMAQQPDGFWIDMNEPSSFDTNMQNVHSNTLRAGLQCPRTELDFPPYPTQHVRGDYNPSKTLADHTMCMTTVQECDLCTQPSTLRHYDVHSLYGWAETRATRAAIDALMPGRRSLVVSRSTFVGSGRWGAHWTGDNFARWSDMRRSLIGVLEFNMFGIPHVGSDICGFNGDTTEPLCLRWTQLGAFYPFSRNHNAIGAKPQDPAQWPSVAAAARQALGMRYRLLPYLYTLFYRAASAGKLVVRPLAFQFPADAALRGVDTQFLWGGALMVAPILDEHAPTSVNVTFPAGAWFDLRDGSLAFNATTSAVVHYRVPMEEMIPMFAWSGAILPLQTPELTTAASRRNAFQLAVFGVSAAGELYWDDGETPEPWLQDDIYLASFTFSNNTLSMNVEAGDGRHMTMPVLSEVAFHGVHAQPAAVDIDGSSLPPEKMAFDAALNRLTITVELDMAQNHTMHLMY